MLILYNADTFTRNNSLSEKKIENVAKSLCLYMYTLCCFFLLLFLIPRRFRIFELCLYNFPFEMYQQFLFNLKYTKFLSVEIFTIPEKLCCRDELFIFIPKLCIQVKRSNKKKKRSKARRSKNKKVCNKKPKSQH